MSSDVPYTSLNRWPAPLEHLEEYITSTGHNLTVNHNKGDRIEDKYAEFRQKMNTGKNPSSSDGRGDARPSNPR
jgi:hypothetical protein